MRQVRRLRFFAQRFGDSPNLNAHFRTLVLDGAVVVPLLEEVLERGRTHFGGDHRNLTQPASEG